MRIRDWLLFAFVILVAILLWADAARAETLAVPAGRTVQLEGRDYRLDQLPGGVLSLPSGSTLAGVPGRTRLVIPPGPRGFSIHIPGDNVTVKDVELVGGGIFVDKAGGDFNRGIVIENVTFRTDRHGREHGASLTWTSGLADSRVRGCGFYSDTFSIYGYNGRNLLIEHNEIDGAAYGLKLSGFRGDNDNVVVQKNWIKNTRNMGMEIQWRWRSLLVQDNVYELPRLSPVFAENNNTFAYSIIADESVGTRIRRNTLLAPQRPDGTGVRIGFEVGGDDCIVEDNWVDGVNHVVAANDGTGTSSVLVRNNRFANFLLPISQAHAAAGRTLRVEGRNDAATPLTWDVNRPRPTRQSQTALPTPPATQPASIQPTTAPSGLEALTARVADLERRLAAIAAAAAGK